MIGRLIPSCRPDTPWLAGARRSPVGPRRMRMRNGHVSTRPLTLPAGLLHAALPLFHRIWSQLWVVPWPGEDGERSFGPGVPRLASACEAVPSNPVSGRIPGQAQLLMMSSSLSQRPWYNSGVARTQPVVARTSKRLAPFGPAKCVGQCGRILQSTKYSVRSTNCPHSFLTSCRNRPNKKPSTMRQATNVAAVGQPRVSSGTISANFAITSIVSC